MMELENIQNITFKQSLTEKKEWLENLSAAELKAWIREFIWKEVYFPLDIPKVSSPISHLSNLLRDGSPKLKVITRTVLPELLKEWDGMIPAHNYRVF